MIIEAIGLPGSGKTFLFKQLEKELKNNYIVVNFTELSRNKFWVKIVVKIALSCIAIPLFFHNMKKELYSILKQELPFVSHFGIYASPSYCVHYAILLILLYNISLKRKYILLFDEGMLHNVIKMCAEFDFSNQLANDFAEKCQKLAQSSAVSSKIMVVYNQYSIEKTLVSIKNRDRHVSVFDELSKTQLQRILKKYEQLNIQLKQKNCIIVSREDNLEQNIFKILNHLKKLEGKGKSW